MATILNQTTARRLITGGNPAAPAGPPNEEDFVPRAWLDAFPYRTPDDDDAPHDDYLPAPEVATIAHALIGEHRALFKHLDEVEIDFRWKRRGGSSAGKVTLGKCIKVSGLTKVYTTATWTIWLAADHCLTLDAYQLEALIFHELLHAEEDEDGKPTIAPHDFEGFGKEIEHYGLWKRDLVLAGRAVQSQQLPLFSGAR